MHLFYSDSRLTGVWEALNEISSPDLARGASKLPNLLDAGLAVKTIEKYRKAWQDWSEWAERYEEVNEIPADPFFIALYFNELVNEKKRFLG